MNLKEIKLSSSDYSAIKDRALKEYVDNAVKEGYNYNVYCIVHAFMAHLAANNWVLKDGKIFEKESNKAV